MLETLKIYQIAQDSRPEILNRIGENIVVFDFIRPDIAEQILLSQLGKIIQGLAAERKITLTLSETALSSLMENALGNLSKGKCATMRSATYLPAKS